MERIEIRTGRLILRDHIMEDLADNHCLISNSKNMYYLPGLMSHSMEDTESSLENVASEKVAHKKKHCRMHSRRMDRVEYVMTIEDHSELYSKWHIEIS